MLERLAEMPTRQVALLNEEKAKAQQIYE